MEMHPAVAFGAALAGGAIGGLLWAFLAIPFAATIQATASIWIERHEVLENEFTKEQEARAREKRRRRREEKEHRSLGERTGGWLRSSRGWLRRGGHEGAEAKAGLEVAPAVDGVVAADALASPISPAPTAPPSDPPDEG
jgi:hypothetical protein